jgi:hypothetical protein
MHAELMGSARHRLQFQQRPPSIDAGRGTEQPPACRGGPPQDRIDAGSRRPQRIRRQRQVHDSLITVRTAMHDRLVSFPHRPGLERPAQRGPRRTRPRKHEQARRVAVEPMHRLDGAECSTQVRRDTGWIEWRSRRHARHTRRLVDHDKIGVGVHDTNATVARRRSRRLVIRPLHRWPVIGRIARISWCTWRRYHSSPNASTHAASRAAGTPPPCSTASVAVG